MNEDALPAGWVWTRLREILDSVKGKKPKNLGVRSDFLTHPYINIEAFENKIFNQYTDGNGCRLCEPNDILIVWDGARCGLIGRGVGGAIGSTLAKLVCRDINSSYLFYFLKLQYENINKRPRGVGIPHVEPDIFWNINFPIPPLPEQRRIVTKIEELFTKLDTGVSALKKTRAQLKRYRQSVLKAACEGKLVPTEAELARAEGHEYESADVLLAHILKERREKWNGKGKYKEPAALDIRGLPQLLDWWVWTSLDSLLIEPLRNGHSAKSSLDENGVRTLTLTAVTQRDFSEKNTKITIADPKRVENLWLKYGDILIERSNTIEYVGLSALYLGKDSFAIFPDLLIRARVSLSYVNPQFVEYTLRMPLARRYFKSKAQGISGTMPKIDQTTIERLPIPLPPLAEQRRIVAEVERRLSVADEVAGTVEQSLAQAQRLRQSILKKAFEGKLVAQNPEDEPAGVLLERIRLQKQIKQPKKGSS